MWQDIENMLMAWMKNNNSKKWSIKLKIVQFQKNFSYHRIIDLSIPYKALFKCDPKDELTTSNLSIEVLNKLTIEEDLGKYFTINKKM